MRLHILHTNDVHSELDAFARLATELRALREELLRQGEAVLTIDVGDHVDLAHPLTSATAGRVNAEILRAVGYDGFVFGNNETLTIPVDMLAPYVQCTGSTLYCSNLQLPHEVSREGVFLTIKGVSVGLFGVTTYYEGIMESLRVAVSDPREAAWRTARSLRAGGADVVIMLSHMGLHVDEQLVDEGLPVDVILSAHTHQFLDHGDLRNNTLLCQAGRGAKAFGHVQVVVTAGRVESASACLRYTEPTVAADAAVVDVLQAQEHATRAWMNTPIVTLQSPIPHSLFGESMLANVLCDQVRDECGTDLCILNGGVLTAGYATGTVRQKDILANCATPMRPVVLHVDGRTIATLMQQGTDRAIIERQGFGCGFRGHFIGRLHISGGYVLVHSEVAPDGTVRQSMDEIWVGDTRLVPDREYSLAVGEFMALSPTYPVLRGRAISYHPDMLRTILARAVQQRQHADARYRTAP